MWPNETVRCNVILSLISARAVYQDQTFTVLKAKQLKLKVLTIKSTFPAAGMLTCHWWENNCWLLAEKIPKDLRWRPCKSCPLPLNTSDATLPIISLFSWENSSCGLNFWVCWNFGNDSSFMPKKHRFWALSNGGFENWFQKCFLNLGLLCAQSYITKFLWICIWQKTSLGSWCGWITDKPMRCYFLSSFFALTWVQSENLKS